MEDLARWAAMDGYAFYVWASYAVTAVLIGGALALTAGERRAAMRDLSRLEATGRRRDRTRRSAVADRSEEAPS